MLKRFNLSRRKALSLGLSGSVFLAAGSRLLSAATAAQKSAPGSGNTNPSSGLPDTEGVSVAIINRDRKWMDPSTPR
jgi:hypothetical protein